MAESRAIARTAGRALDLLLFLVDRGQSGLTARELAGLLGAPRTSVTDLLKVLQGRGFVTATVDRRWRLDFRVAQLGNAYLHEFSVREVGRTVMRELSRRTGLTTQMAVLDQGDVVYIERQDPNKPVTQPHVVTDIGSRLPAYCTSLGKAMLAYMPDNEVDRLYGGDAGMAARTKNTITTLARLRTELALVRRRGYAVDIEETTEGIVCVGAAIIGRDGRPEGALSVTSLSAGLSRGTIESFGRIVARAAKQVESARGGVVRALRRPAAKRLAGMRARRRAAAR